MLKDRHWLTSKPYWEQFFVAYIAAVSVAWIGYIKFHWYQVFVTCFTLQVLTTLFKITLYSCARTSNIELCKIVHIHSELSGGALDSQVILAALISLSAGPDRLRPLWILFLISIVCGKAAWVRTCSRSWSSGQPILKLKLILPLILILVRILICVFILVLTRICMRTSVHIR